MKISWYWQKELLFTHNLALLILSLLLLTQPVLQFNMNKYQIIIFSLLIIMEHRWYIF